MLPAICNKAVDALQLAKICDTITTATGASFKCYKIIVTGLKKHPEIIWIYLQFDGAFSHDIWIVLNFSLVANYLIVTSENNV